MSTPTAVSQPSPRHRRRSFRRRLGRLAVGAVLALLVVALIGALFQVVAQERDAAAHPPPGEHVQLPDGRSLHLQVAGRDHDGPTVVLESGAGGTSAGWGWVQPAVAEHATVVSYDRSGLGWSDGKPHAGDATAVVADLRHALTALDLPRPYVLVGHSLGGHYVRTFAAQHPEEVAGLVLVDPSHERQSAETGEDMADFRPMFTALQLGARIGALRVYNPSAADIELLPEPHRSQALAQLAATRTADAQAAEMLNLDVAAAGIAGERGALGALPVRVLIATGGETNEDNARTIAVMARLREELTEMSTAGQSVVLPEASHVSIITHPDHAAVVTDTVLDVLDEVGSTSRR